MKFWQKLMRNLKKVILGGFMGQYVLFIGLLFIAGCASLGLNDFPGAIKESVSGFDNTSEISMEPAWLSGGSNMIKLGLFKTSKMEMEDAVLVVIVKGAYNFSPKGSLQFNIDSQVITMDSIDDVAKIDLDEGVYNSVAYIPPSNWSSKRYDVNKGLIDKLIKGKEVWVKVNLVHEYAEGKFSVDAPTCARPAFRKFYERVWSAK